MGLIGSLIQRRTMTLAELDASMDRALSGVSTMAGIDIGPDSALRNSAVWACVRVISQTVASLPLITYRRRADGGKERDPSHPLYSLLHDRPNPEQTSFQFWETAVSHLLTWGNHYSQIVANDYGVVELWPLRPDRMEVGRSQAGELRFRYRLDDGTLRYFAFHEIFHVAGLSFDGVTGLSPIAYAREAIALGLEAEAYGARFFANDSRPGGVLSVEGTLKKDGKQALKEEWESLHRAGNQHRIAVLDAGAKFQAVGLPPEDAQFIQTQRWTVEQTARFYGVPLHKIQSLDKATFSNIEHQAIEFVVDCIRPTCARVEASIKRDIFKISDGKRTHYAEFLLDGLLRGDIKSRYEAYAVGRQNGWLCGNEIRALENMNPMADGDVYLVNGNMVPIKTAIEPPEPPPPPAPPVPEPEEDEAPGEETEE